MQIPIPSPVARFASVVGSPVYLVGGAVRNALLGLPHTDLDVAGALPPEAVEARCRAADLPVMRMNRSLGTLAAVVDGETVEYTAFRAERYGAGGAHRPESVSLGAGLAADAVRRDFTCNALYAACGSGVLLDPTGGLADLQNGVLRQAGADTLRSDALRILRMVRFACELGFTVEPQTFALAAANVSGLADIAPERRREEFDRILLADVRYPSAGRAEARSVLRALHLLTELAAWPHLIPEMTAGAGMAQRSDHHKYEVMEHMFRVCAASRPDPVLRLAGLLHDIGKPACKRETGRMYDHAAYGEPIARRCLTALRYPTAMIDAVAALVRSHMYDIQDAARTETLRGRFVLWGRPLTERMIELREADIRGGGFDPTYVNVRWRALYRQMCADGTPFTEAELRIDGRGIMAELGIGAGARVGALKSALLQHCAKHPEDNNAETLRKLLRDMA